MDSLLLKYAPLVVFAMLIPYFLFGLLIASLLRDCEKKELNVIYFCDMAGGANRLFVAAYLVMQAGWV